MLISAGFFGQRTAQEGLAGAWISLEHDAATFVNEPAAGQISNNATIQRTLVDVQNVMDICFWETELRLLDQPFDLFVILSLIDAVRQQLETVIEWKRQCLRIL